ncbi:SH3 domain-containing protein [Jiella pacifica]|uniref:SH3 domain-containing protein n=1 Tax=Jiella pacifica TaxID=2696469 RepID=A0A6N9T5G8_9HYPH|nr:SH3 domain-containing protein [Jiella pacifica]NDW05822.1 SH3 domain-containing protein [Jiella pacifica]
MRSPFVAFLIVAGVLLGPPPAEAQYAQGWQASIERWLYGLESRTATAACIDRLKNRAITFIGIAEDEPRIGSGRRRDLNSLIVDAIPGKYTPRLGRAYRQMVEGILPQRAGAVGSAEALQNFFGSDMFLTVEPERRLPEILRLYLGLTILDPETGQICATETGPTLTLDLNRLGTAELADTFSSREFYDVDGALREASLKAIARLQQHQLLKDPTVPLAYRVTADADGADCRLSDSIDDTFNSAYTELSGDRQRRINETIGATSWPLLRRLPPENAAAAQPPIEGVFLQIDVAPAPDDRLGAGEDGTTNSAVLKLDVSVQHSNGANVGRYGYRVVVPRSEVANCLPKLAEAVVAPEPLPEEIVPPVPEPDPAAACAAGLDAARAGGSVAMIRAFVAANSACAEERRLADLLLDSIAASCAAEADTLSPAQATARLDVCLAEFSGSVRHEIGLKAARDRATLRERSAAAEAERQKREAALRDQLEADYRARLEEIESRLERERREREAAEIRAAEARAEAERQAAEARAEADHRADEARAEAERRAAEARANASRGSSIADDLRRCVVADPSPTPLNVRASPGNTGKVIGTLKDGHVVFVLREYPGGKPWAYVADTVGGGTRELGWVYRPYIRC